jgi:hypothetical protein
VKGSRAFLRDVGDRMFPDPFAIPEKGFEPYEAPQNGPEFSQPDLTPRTIKSFLRSEEVQKEVERIVPQPTRSAPQRGEGRLIGWSLGRP